MGMKARHIKYRFTYKDKFTGCVKDVLRVKCPTMSGALMAVLGNNWRERYYPWFDSPDKVDLSNESITVEVRKE